MMILEILSVKVGILLIRKELYGFIHMSCHHLQGLIQKVIILCAGLKGDHMEAEEEHHE